MSFQAMALAVRVKGLTTSEKLTLLMLANYADERLTCFPSQRTLSEDTGLSDKWLRQVLSSLESRGIIVRQERRRDDGSRSSDLIRLIGFLRVEESSGGGELTSGGVGNSLPGGGELTSPHEPIIEPIIRTLSPSPSARVIPFDQTEWGERFEEAKEVAGDAADLTRPAMLHCRDLRALVEPSSGEPCEWGEVLDAIRVVAARQRTRGKPITTWKWVEQDALALRDRRLAGLRDPQVQPMRTDFAAQQSAMKAAARKRAMEMLGGD